MTTPARAFTSGAILDLLAAAAGAALPLCAAVADWQRLSTYTPGEPASEAEYYTVLVGVVLAIIAVPLLRRIPIVRHVVPFVIGMALSLVATSILSVAIFYLRSG